MARSGGASSNVRVGSPPRPKASSARLGASPSASRSWTAARSPAAESPTTACSWMTGRPAACSGNVGAIRHSAQAKRHPTSARRRISPFYLTMGGSMRWPLLEPVRTRLADEQGTLRKQAATRIALCYPSPYQVGMSSLGFQTIYREIHGHEDATAERAFLPDDVAAWREARVPLCTYESQQPVAEFSCLAFSVSYELELTGVFEMLELAGLPILREERDDRHPLVVCGGPLTFSNPVPLAPFADVVVLGESEDLIHVLCDALTLPRHELRSRLSQHPGFYLPGLSSTWPEVAKADDDRLPARSQIVTPHTELRSMFLIEPELVSLLAKSGAKTLTTAADGASERLRVALDRRTTAAQLLRVAGLAREAGFQRLKLYLMLGLPGEEDRDLDELAELAADISRIVPLSFGCAPFVAKRNTPMDGTAFVPIEETERRIAYLRAKLRGRAEIRPTSPRWAWVEYMLAQGGEDAGLAALDAWRAAGTFAAWKRAFRERGVRPFGARRVRDGRLRLPQLAAWPSI